MYEVKIKRNNRTIVENKKFRTKKNAEKFVSKVKKLKKELHRLYPEHKPKAKYSHLRIVKVPKRR